MNKQKKTITGSIIGKKQISSSSNDVPPHRRHNRSGGQNVLLIWLDNNIDAEHNDYYRKTITQLRGIVNKANTFTDYDQCIDFLTDIVTVKVFMILSGELSQHIVPLIHDITQLDCIYILCDNKTCHEEWIKEWPKVKRVFTDITPIYEVLDEMAQEYEHDAIGISFKSTSDTGASNKNLNQLDCSFMYSQILKEILLTIQFDEQHVKQYINYCQKLFADNIYKLDQVNNFERTYREKPIWWYTSDSFLYPMLNRALRTMDVDIIIKMGFFIRELHQDIKQRHSHQFGGYQLSQTLELYRGQSLSKTDFDQLMKTKGGLMSFNCFLSTSEDRDMSLTFARKGLWNPDLVGILFVITGDPSESNTPFTSINDVSCFEEDEVLFSMHTVFRIHDIEPIDETNRLWQVNLTLTRDNDQELLTLTERMREEICPGEKGWHRLGLLLLTMGQSEKAQQVYEVMLKQTTVDREKAAIYGQLGSVKYNQGKNEEALEFYNKAFEILQKIPPGNHPLLTVCYNNIGSVYLKIGEYSNALSYMEKALIIYQNTLPENHPDLGNSYNNIGEVYRHMSEYPTALSYLEKALEIYQNTLPTNHPALGGSYNNIGLMYHKMGEYPNALPYLKKALEIKQKSLLENHPDLASSWNNIGKVYLQMNEYSEALSSHEKALEIRQKSLSSNHPDLAESFNNIGWVYYNMNDCLKGLPFCERAVNIAEQSLSSNHPDFQLYRKTLDLMEIICSL